MRSGRGMGGTDHPNRINFNLALTHWQRMGIGEMRNIFAFDFIIMSPGQDILTAIESAVKILAVFASKIERGSARRIGHQNNG
ncbi:MAG: hypothetical protein QOH31_997 [Verrucomicrobiota bacterium]